MSIPRTAQLWTLVLVFAVSIAAPGWGAEAKLPWAAAGLTERQAAAHLLDRFAYGPRPGEIDRVVDKGLEAWLEEQLQGSVDDSEFLARVAMLDIWSMSSEEILKTFPSRPRVRREAQQAGVLSADAPLPGPPPEGQSAPSAERREQSRKMQEFSREKGYRNQRELLGQLMAHKLFQAVYSQRQLEAVLTDFWFNHFNVSMTDNQSRVHLLAYERDAISPGVLGSFHELLVETAAHPAMLTYLDNTQSTAKEGVRTTAEMKMAELGQPRGNGRRGFGSRPGGMQRPQQNSRPRGLNENFARELMELHTLGVNGGYTQEDVIEVARAFTGWSVLPQGPQGARARAQMERMQAMGMVGFTIRDAFIFRADAHDAEPKKVLGKKLPAGRGIEDGLEVLELLASRPETAGHLSHKLAVRFVSDEPPATLEKRLAETFLSSGGNIGAVLRTLAYAPEFWADEARHQKIKSPFEVAVSAVRALGAEVTDPGDLVEWVSRMGEPLYAYQAPTGYPDRVDAWVNTGSLLTRMNFGLNLATGRVLGVEHDLAALNRNREPASLEDALATYAALLMPERDLEATLERLQPMVSDPEVLNRLTEAAPDEGADTPAPRRRYGQLRTPQMEADNEMMAEMRAGGPDAQQAQRRMRRRMREMAALEPPSPLANVVGVILGSPEFQRQ